MAPSRIVFLRHAEKPGPEYGAGVDPSGAPDAGSLAVRGWQRAGALARMLSAHDDPRLGRLRPSAIFAPRVDARSKSKRSSQTVDPLVALLNASERVRYVTTYEKTDARGVMNEVLAQRDVVLVSWEHKMLPALPRCVPGAPAVPALWTPDRFDLLWILDRTAAGWSFSQHPQLLLAGDRADPIV